MIISRTNRSASSPRKVGVALIGFAMEVKIEWVYIKLTENFVILKLLWDSAYYQAIDADAYQRIEGDGCGFSGAGEGSHQAVEGPEAD